VAVNFVIYKTWTDGGGKTADLITCAINCENSEISVCVNVNKSESERKPLS
jgi:hypothetical protein